VIKILHVAEQCNIGGAGRAAYRIHDSFRRQRRTEVISEVFATHSDNNCSGVSLPGNGATKAWLKVQPYIGPSVLRLFKTTNTTIRTIAGPQAIRNKLIKDRAKEADIVNVHWLGNSSWTVRQVAEVAKMRPLVWTMHDKWAFSGVEHYEELGQSLVNGITTTGLYNWLEELYFNGKQIESIAHMVKRRLWKRPFYVVCPSHWMRECVRNSSMMHDWPIRVIPNSIDTDFWKPLCKLSSRIALEIPKEKIVILFGATGGSRDPRKGHDLLVESLKRVAENMTSTELANIELLIFGETKPQISGNILPIQARYMGCIHDDLTLRLVYNSSDIFILPSRLDNLPNTGVEAHSCGIPVVAFDTGGLNDIVQHGQSGFLAKPFETKEMARYITLLTREHNLRSQMSKVARNRALSNWSYDKVSAAYLDYYSECIQHFQDTASEK